MRTVEQSSREIIEIMGEIVSRVSAGCKIRMVDYRGKERELDCPPINYVFGSSTYVKDVLDELSHTPKGNEIKFPLIALFCPLTERRYSGDYYSKAKARILIACSSIQQWSNEQRLQTSFVNILRPIYRRFLEELKEDPRLDFGYDDHISHEYSENYSYGRYGAIAGTGEAVSEPIDAINITNLEITVKNPNCKI